ncbi:hypothetical protein [Rhizobium sp. BK176]|uniref:hypothetical protein n=1 Tax=Rhizobium sp. BK176 TaxID=2587071 RepID=UPI00216752A0|nr:hypothetical protein [Rhizobium sp. BK176]MCS4089165.1 hypothetical protein [Rhizobium sp. BK176]
MTDHNRNGHLSRFEDYAPIKRSLDEIVERAIAFKKGDKDVYDEPEPTVVASFATSDLVRYRLNSTRLADAYIAMGDTNTHPHDDDGYTDRCARFGVVDRASGEPVAMLWVLKSRRDDTHFKICHPSFSKTRALEQGEFLDVLKELDIPPSHRNGEDNDFVREYDLWYEDGEWIAKEPQSVLAFRYESICFGTHPPIRDTVTIYVPLDPSTPLDGGGDARAAYNALDHYRGLAQQKFWAMRYPVQSGHSSWLGPSDPTEVKVTDPRIYAECIPDVAPTSDAVQTLQP